MRLEAYFTKNDAMYIPFGKAQSQTKNTSTYLDQINCPYQDVSWPEK